MAHFYSIQSQIEEISAEAAAALPQHTPMAVLLTPAEAETDSFLVSHCFVLSEHPQTVRFCKAESHLNYLYGTISIPPKGHRAAASGFHYLVFHNRIFIIESGDLALQLMQKLAHGATRKASGIGFLLSDLLDLLTADDLLRLTGYENQLAHLEDEVLAGTLDHFNHKITGCRRLILSFSHYYLQLADVANVFQQNDLGFFAEKELIAFRLFSERAGRLHEEALMLREYSTQIREVYQAQIDIQQNQIMKILTIVTTIFMPLTLMVGWYGMNFENMPELRWHYGYLAFAVLCGVILLLALWVCRKKKFL